MSGSFLLGSSQWTVAAAGINTSSQKVTSPFESLADIPPAQRLSTHLVQDPADVTDVKEKRSLHPQLNIKQFNCTGLKCFKD